MAKEQDDFNIDDIVIEEIDIEDIEDRNQFDVNLKEDDLFVKEEQSEEAAVKDVKADEKEFAEDSEEYEEAGDGCAQADDVSDEQTGADEEEREENDTRQDYGDTAGAQTAEDYADAADCGGDSVRIYVEEHMEDDDEEDDDDDQDEDRPKRGKGNALRYVIMFVALGVLVYALYSLISIFMEYRAGEQIYEDLSKYAVATQQPVREEEPKQEYIDETYPLNPNFTPAVVDWDALLAQNPDICGWIQFESDSLKGQINYPIAHSADNEYYLKHTINYEENSAGSIFIEAQNRTDFSDMNTFVYGHNMKNGSMFGLLRYYKEADYYTGNEYFWIYTPQGNYRYKIFSCYEPKAESETYTWWSDPCDEYTEYLKKVQSYSKYETGVTVKPTDHIVTLSTCTSRGSDYRFVVHGKLVYSEIKQSAVQTETAGQ